MKKLNVILKFLEDYKLFVLGEGIETDTKDFKEEVASQLSEIK